MRRGRRTKGDKEYEDEYKKQHKTLIGEKQRSN